MTAPTIERCTGTLELQQAGRRFRHLAGWIQLGFVLLGMALFLDRAGPLISDAQLTWGERWVAGALAVILLGGAWLAGWLLGLLVAAAGAYLEVAANAADATIETRGLVERILLDAFPGKSDVAGGRRAAAGVQDSPDSIVLRTLRADLSSALLEGDILRVMGIRDELTMFLRGKPLVELDRHVAGWLIDHLRSRLAAGTIAADSAKGLEQALDSLGEIPEAAPLRNLAAELRQRWVACPRCGAMHPAVNPRCPNCLQRKAEFPPASPSNPLSGSQGSP
jgi:hypothetical protein